MPVNKSALLRYRIIDSCLTNPYRTYPTMEFMIDKIEEQIGTSISKSMFTKDIENMRITWDAPIKFDRYHKGYCYTEKEFSIKEFPLTHDEIEALDYSTALLNHLKNTRMFDQFESAINKVIEGYRISKMIGKSEKQILQVEEPLRSEGNQWLELILKSIVEKNCLKVTYQGFGKDKKDHEFSCYLLKEYRNRWYAVGFSKIARNVLILALDRVIKIEICKGSYVSDQNFIPADYFKYSLGITQIDDAKPERVILYFTNLQAPYILSQPLHSSQKVISEDDGLTIEINVYISHELIQTVLSYGEQVKVLKPERFKKEIKTILKKTFGNYN
jgi:predicted DNA-binding transcriptional regulator YafY